MIKDFFLWWMFDQSEICFQQLISICSEKQLDEYFSYIKQKKKILCVYGNCQTKIIKDLLVFHEKVQTDYIVLNLPMVYEYEDEQQIREILNIGILWKSIDLFIYQKVKENNKFSIKLATNYILPKLNKQCQKVCISSIFFGGYFIQYHPVLKRVDQEFHQSGLFPFGDKFIDEYMMKAKRTNEEIEEFLARCSSENFLSEAEIKKICEDSLNELKIREKDVDVKIGDYIEKNYMKEQLFYSVNHPNHHVMYEYANRILNYLGYNSLPKISEMDLYMLFGTLKGQDIPIYPAVVKALNLKKVETLFYPNRYMITKYPLDFISYQKEYIKNFY